MAAYSTRFCRETFIKTFLSYFIQLCSRKLFNINSNWIFLATTVIVFLNLLMDIDFNGL